MQEVVLTITGKEPKVSHALRMPLTMSQRVIELCKFKGKTFTDETLRLWEKELQKEGSSREPSCN